MLKSKIIFSVVFLLVLSSFAAGEVELKLTTGEIRYFAEDVFMLKLDLDINEESGFLGDVYLIVVDPNGSVYFAPEWKQETKTILSNFFFPPSINFQSALIIEQHIPNRTFPMLNEGEYTFAIGIAMTGTASFLDIASCITEYNGEREWMVINEDDGIETSMLSVVEDRMGEGYWLGSSNKSSIYHYNNVIDKKYVILNGSAGAINGLVYDNQNRLWAGCYGLHRYNSEEDMFDKFIPPFEGEGMNYKATISSVLYDLTENAFWLASLAGLGRFNVQEESWFYYTTEDGLLSDLLYDLEYDNDNNIWIASLNKDNESFGGVSRFDRINFENFVFDNPFLTNYMKLGFDSEGCIWFSTSIIVYRNINGDWIEKGNGLQTGNLKGFYLDRFGRFWCLPDAPMSILEPDLLARFEDDLWVPVLTEIKDLGIELCFNMYQDKLNNFWFLGYPKIVIRWGSE